MQTKSLTLTGAFLLALIGVSALTSPQEADAQQKAKAQTMDTTPLSCNLSAMTPAQRQRYSVLKIRLQAAVLEVKELPDGYAFRYTDDPATFLAAAEFITLESRCCPFFHFVLEHGHDGGPTWLRITGPKAVKPFIKEALAC